MLRRYQFLWTLVVIVAVLVAARAALPWYVEDYVNEKLNALEEYDGRVTDVDVALWRGAYRVEGLRIVKTGAHQPTPFFSSEAIDFSIEWPSLMRGSLVAEGTFLRPNLNLVKGPNDRESQTGEGVDWVDRLEEMFPFRFNTVRIVDGTVTFRAPGIRTKDALRATKLDGVISNITNAAGTDRETFAGFRVEATVLDKGTAKVSGSVDPLAHEPTFDLNLTVRNVHLPKVNPWLRQYIKADAESGEFELYTELAAAEGRFKGYAKPIMRDVNIYSSEEEESNLLRRAWEGLVDLATRILEDEETDQVAARIPFSGSIEEPDADLLETMVSVVRNAFVSAFARSLEGSITLRDARESLGEIAGDDEEGKDGDKKKEESKSARKPDHGPKRG